MTLNHERRISETARAAIKSVLGTEDAGRKRIRRVWTGKRPLRPGVYWMWDGTRKQILFAKETDMSNWPRLTLEGGEEAAVGSNGRMPEGILVWGPIDEPKDPAGERK